MLTKARISLLVTIGSADPSARMSESRTHYEVAGGEDKEFIVIEGADHSYNPAGPKAGARNQREQLIEVLADWLSERFPL